MSLKAKCQPHYSFLFMFTWQFKKKTIILCHMCFLGYTGKDITRMKLEPNQGIIKKREGESLTPWQLPEEPRRCITATPDTSMCIGLTGEVTTRRPSDPIDGQGREKLASDLVSTINHRVGTKELVKLIIIHISTVGKTQEMGVGVRPFFKYMSGF